MYLTKEEERILNGEFGWANQTCMKILVRLGDLFNATRLIPIHSAHTSGVSYKTLGDAPVDFLEALANAKARTKVTATLNPQSFDSKYLCRKLPTNLCQKQSQIMEHFEKMGFKQSLTCTPYYLEKPKKDSHLAWAESSAVIYANSILEAWTNREGGPSALASAIIGKTPNYGMHKAENRQPQVLVKLEKALQSEIEFGALGIYLGKVLENKIPIIQGLQNASDDDLKQLGAAMASAGMTNMFCRKARATRADKLERITAEANEIKKEIENLSTASQRKPDLIFVGCPHCSLDEIKQIDSLICNKNICENTEFWVCTSRYIKEKARKYIKRMEKRGIHVLTDTCTVVTWTEKLGIKTIMTNSAKTAYYAPTLNKARTLLAPLKQCLDAVFEG